MNGSKSEMSSEDIEFEGGDGEAMLPDNTEEGTIKSDDQTTTTAAAVVASTTTTTTSQQALKQLNQLTANTSTNVTNRLSPGGNVAVATVNASNLQKIEPKLTTMPKIVYIKNGAQPAIRIGGSLPNSANSNSNASQPGCKTVQLVQLKNKSGVVSSMPATNRIVLKSGSGQTQKFILAGGPAKIGTAGPSGTNTRTLTMSQAQQMGLILPSNKTNTTAASTSSSTTTKTVILPATASAAAGNIALKSANQPTILNKGVKPLQPSKFVIQSDSGGDGDAKVKTATATSAPSIVKVANTGQPMRVIQGQYVRVLNAIPSGSANNAAAKLVNGGQKPVIVQRKIVPQQNAQIGAGGKPQQFVTKKLEVMPIGSTTKLIKKEPGTQAAKAPTTYLLNNVQKNIITSSIDIKPVISSQSSDSFEISDIKEESGASKKFASRTYSLSSDRKSKSPEPNPSNLMYSTLKLPSPEPIEGNFVISIHPSLIQLIDGDFFGSFSLSLGIRRKHCNCTKSQCLKLYCDCFANGEFCSNCNCKECFNTLEKEDERQKAIKICLERNPHAFK